VGKKVGVTGFSFFTGGLLAMVPGGGVRSKRLSGRDWTTPGPGLSLTGPRKQGGDRRNF